MEVQAPATPQVIHDRLRVTLEQAFVLACARNQELRVHVFDPPIASTAVDIQRAAFDPQLALQVSHAQDRSSTPSTTISTAAGVVGISGVTSASRTDTISAEVTQPLPTGTQFAVGVSSQRQEVAGFPGIYTSRPFVTVTQSLLRGASLSANLASLHIAQVGLRISQFEFRGFSENLLARIDSAYWDLCLAQRQITLVSNGLDLARRQSSDIQDRIDVGTMAENERAAAQAEVAVREQAQIDAQSALEKARLQFLRLIGPKGQDWWYRPVDLLTDPETLPDDPAQTADERVLVAIHLRPDVNQARLQIEQGTLEVVQTRNGLMPQLSFFTTLGTSGYGQSLGPSLHRADGNNYDVSFGLSAVIDLCNRSERAQFHRAVLTREQSQAALRDLEQMVEVDVRTAVVEVERAHAQIGASAATARLRRESLENEKARLLAGKGTAFIVAQADRDLLGSDLDRIAAVIAYRKALTQLHLQEGSLLQRIGIDVPGAGTSQVGPEAGYSPND